MAETSKTEAYFSKYPVRSYSKGQIFVHSGDDPSSIYYLARGNVRQYTISYRGDEIVVNVFKPGAFFPMLWALTKLPNQYFFSAETDVELRAAPVDSVVDFLKSNPDIALDLLTRVYIGLDGVLGRMTHLMAGSARSRLIYELIIECRRFGVKTAEANLRININESMLAARAGLSRETVSREIRKLTKSELVSVSRDGIVIKDIDRLEAKLGKEL